MLPETKKGRRVGATQFFHWVPQGSASQPDLGKAASNLGDAIHGQTCLRAFVGGEIEIPQAFTFGHDPRFFLGVDAAVDGGIRFATLREGSVLGDLIVWIRGSITGSFRLVDRATGGVANKKIVVRAALQGDLEIVLGESGNTWDFELDIFGAEAGGAKVTSLQDRMSICSDTYDSKSRVRRIEIVGPALK